MKLRFAILAFFSVALFACSTPDDDDLDEIKASANLGNPTNQGMMRKKVLQERATEYLRGKPKGAEVIKIECTTFGMYANETSEFAVTVGHVLKCLTDVGTTYESCLVSLAAKWIGIKKTEAIAKAAKGPSKSPATCTSKVSPFYAPEVLKDEGFLDDSEVTQGDITKSFVGLPAPLPGWVFDPRWVLVLCPLGQGGKTGCPTPPAGTGSDPGTFTVTT